MSFLNAAFLAGLPLIAIPLLIHLLSRRQQKRIAWGAMRFLKEAAARRRRLWRLTDLLLLLLRTAAFLLFIGALARPLLSASWLGDSLPREIIVVIDQSMSMSRKAGGTSLFDLQREKAHALLGNLKGRESVRILLAGDSPEWLTPEAVRVTPAAIRKLNEQLDGLQPTLGASDLLACVRDAADLEASKEISSRLIVIFSDRQRVGWQMDERPLWNAIQARLKRGAVPCTVSIEFLTESEPDTDNLCVNRIESPRPFAAINQALNLTAQVQNHGSHSSGATLLTWQAAGQPLGITTIPELAPGASTSLSISHQFSAPGLFDITCRIEARDALPADNEAHLLVEVYQQLPVLLVEESNTAGPLEKDSAFVLAALGARKTDGVKTDWRSVFEATVIEPGALAATDLSRYRCVILANVRRIESIDKLEAYVRAGGGLWIALGANTDTAFFNEQIYRGGLGLSPLKLTAPIGDPNDRERFFAIRTSLEPHPATALLSDFQRLDLDRARVYRRHQFDHLSGKDVSVFLQVQQGDPVVIERKLERGRVLVQSIPLGVSWSSLPLCQAYVAMLHEWLWYLAEPALPKRNLAVGESILSSRGAGETAELTLPDQRTVQLEPGMVSGTAEWRYAGTRLPGEYQLRIAGKVSTQFSVLRNIRESDLANLSTQDLEQLHSTDGFQIGLDALAVTGKALPPKYPIEGWLLTALALVLLGELLLAGWTTHRRNLRLAPVSMSA
ncbi:MAG: hypothetical protein JWL90_842 [Chthoniobacteraceae bacterium]|nr:hypothetical protein [Chthoniobacteraceae bacterium]